MRQTLRGGIYVLPPPSFLPPHTCCVFLFLHHALTQICLISTNLAPRDKAVTNTLLLLLFFPPPYALQAVCWAWTLRLRRYESVHLSPRWTSRMYRTWKAAGKKINNKSEWQKDTTLKCKVGPLVDLTSSCELSNLNFTSQLFKSTPNPLTLLGSTFVRLPVFYPPS